MVVVGPEKILAHMPNIFHQPQWTSERVVGGAYVPITCPLSAAWMGVRPSWA